MKQSIAWLQITAGQGPKECGWVVAQVCQKIMQDAEKHKLQCDWVESLAYDKAQRKQQLFMPDAFRSVVLRIEGKTAQTLCQRWIGTIKWQGESPYRQGHKRINWFVGVVPLTAAQSAEQYCLKDCDLTVEAMRASGPGGQHVNKTCSAVRVTHRPSGLVVRVETERSQHRNKQIAIERLQQLLHSQQQAQMTQQVHDQWLNHYQVQRGNPTRCFTGQAFTES